MNRITVPLPRPGLIGLLAILTAAPAASGQQVELRLGGDPGDVHTYAIDGTQSFQLPEEFGGEQSVRITMTVDAELTEVRADTLVYGLTVREPNVELSSGAAGGQTPDLSELEGAKFIQILTASGDAVEFTPPETLGQAGAGIAQSLSQFGSLPLPPGRVAVGDSWSDTARTEGAMGLPAEGDMVTISTITLTGVSEEGGVTIADLSIESDFAFEPAADAEGQPEVDMSGALVQNVRFDVTHGLILGRSAASDFTANLSGGGIPGDVSIYGTSESTITRQ